MAALLVSAAFAMPAMAQDATPDGSDHIQQLNAAEAQVEQQLDDEHSPGARHGLTGQDYGNQPGGAGLNDYSEAATSDQEAANTDASTADAGSNPDLEAAAQAHNDIALPAAQAEALGGNTVDGSLTGGLTGEELQATSGKDVTGANGQMIGTILTVDQSKQMAELQMRNGDAVAIPGALLTMENGKVMAPTVSRLDVMAMAKTQAGSSQFAYQPVNR
jgi:hypothetical protein